MAALKKEALWVRLFVLSAVLAIVAAACGTQEPAASGEPRDPPRLEANRLPPGVAVVVSSARTPWASSRT